MKVAQEGGQLPANLNFIVEVSNEVGYVTRAHFSATRQDVQEFNSISFAPVVQQFMIAASSSAANDDSNLSAFEFQFEVSGMQAHTQANSTFDDIYEVSFEYDPASSGDNQGETSGSDNPGENTGLQSEINSESFSTYSEQKAVLKGILRKDDSMPGKLTLKFKLSNGTEELVKFDVPGDMMPIFEEKDSSEAGSEGGQGEGGQGESLSKLSKTGKCEGCEIDGSQSENGFISLSFDETSSPPLSSLANSRMTRVELPLNHVEEGANFENTIFKESHLMSGDLQENAILKKASLVSASFQTSKIFNTTLQEASAIGSSAFHSYFENLVIDYSNLKSTTLSETAMFQGSITSTNMREADLSRARFYRVTIKDVDLSGAKLGVFFGGSLDNATCDSETDVGLSQMVCVEKPGGKKLELSQPYVLPSDHGNNVSTATGLLSNQQSIGLLYSETETDVFRAENIAANQALTVKLESEGALEVTFSDSDGNPIAPLSDQGTNNSHGGDGDTNTTNETNNTAQNVASNIDGEGNNQGQNFTHHQQFSFAPTNHSRTIFVHVKRHSTQNDDNQGGAAGGSQGTTSGGDNQGETSGGDNPGGAAEEGNTGEQGQLYKISYQAYTTEQGEGHLGKIDIYMNGGIQFTHAVYKDSPVGSGFGEKAVLRDLQGEKPSICAVQNVYKTEDEVKSNNVELRVNDQSPVDLNIYQQTAYTQIDNITFLFERSSNAQYCQYIYFGNSCKNEDGGLKDLSVWTDNCPSHNHDQGGSSGSDNPGGSTGGEGETSGGDNQGGATGGSQGGSSGGDNPGGEGETSGGDNPEGQ